MNSTGQVDEIKRFAVAALGRELTPDEVARAVTLARISDDADLPAPVMEWIAAADLRSLFERSPRVVQKAVEDGCDGIVASFRATESGMARHAEAMRSALADLGRADQTLTKSYRTFQETMRAFEFATYKLIVVTVVLVGGLGFGTFMGGYRAGMNVRDSSSQCDTIKNIRTLAGFQHHRTTVGDLDAALDARHC